MVGGACKSLNGKVRGSLVSRGQRRIDRLERFALTPRSDMGIGPIESPRNAKTGLAAPRSYQKPGKKPMTTAEKQLTAPRVLVAGPKAFRCDRIQPIAIALARFS